MRIIPFIYDDIYELVSNTYLIVDSDNHAVIVDPSKDNDNIINYINKNNITPVAAILTHGHADHMGGVNRLIDKYNLDVYIHKDDYVMLDDPYMNCSELLGKNIIIDRNIKLLDEGELSLLNEDLTIIHTPFHTKGSICIYLNEQKALISGDSLFKQGFGRMDLPNACKERFYDSMRKLFALPDEVKVYPGHGPSTSIGAEKREKYL